MATLLINSALKETSKNGNINFITFRIYPKNEKTIAASHKKGFEVCFDPVIELFCPGKLLCMERKVNIIVSSV
jgi:hypothetical protein